MNIVHKVLIVVGALALIEGAWGLASPKNIKNISGWFVKVSPSSNKALGFLFVVIAIGLCAVVLAGQPLSAWVLLLVAVSSLGMGLLCIKPNGLQHLLTGWILNRSQVFVRVIYGAELVAAAAIIWIALAQK